MKALILVDIQNDFLPGGALAVPQGDEVVSVANRLAARFSLVVATQDWHPPDHLSFAANHAGKQPGDVIELDGVEQILWPVHCVQDSRGAEFADSLDMSRVAQVIRKGTDPRIDSYSGFFDNGRRQETGLRDHLASQNVGEVYLAGLATDYCVKFTALDAASLGLRVYLIEDACRGVNLSPGDVSKAIDEMKAGGVKVIQSHECQPNQTD